MATMKESLSKQAEDDRQGEGSSVTAADYISTKSDKKLESWTKRNNIGVLRHPVLRIREEELNLGRDTGEVRIIKEKLALFNVTSQKKGSILSGPILPSKT